MGGLEKLIAIMIAFGRLTLCDNDILHKNQMEGNPRYTALCAVPSS